MTRRVFGGLCTHTGDRNAARYGVAVMPTEEPACACPDVPPASGMATSAVTQLRLICASVRC
ncbi:hypothetical protein [Ralstonia psammae]|uniref:hypothetical protein n=1 Tax=Ralstonia psammae TaxID=3058598 RepID=UPI00292FED44|nr:hypothetical protein [Ralstonia sp. LMG 19083]